MARNIRQVSNWFMHNKYARCSCTTTWDALQSSVSCQKYHSKSSDSHRPKVRVSLFGLGRIGRVHYENLIQNPHVNLVNVVEFECSIADKYINQYGGDTKVGILAYTEADKVYNDESIDAVIVASSTTTHEEIVMNALQKGKNVFCEKPLSSTIQSTKGCYELAEKKDATLYCAFNRRHDASFSKLEKRIQAGDIGRLQMLRVVARDPAPPPLEYLKVSGHLFKDCTIHQIDLACWVTGSYPTKVYATGSAHFDVTRQCGDIDSATAVLSFPNDVTVVLDSSRATSFGHDQRIEAFGIGGMLIADNHRYTSVELYNESGATKDHMYYFMDRYTQAYKTQMDHFINVLRGNAPISVTGEQVVKGLQIAEACWQSVQTGQAVAVDYSV